MTDITFQTFDTFNREPFADHLTKVITTFYPLADESFVLSLNAPFGAGKTTFLAMWQHKLQQEGYTVISINAWETDFDNEPIIPIVSELLKHIKRPTAQITTAFQKVLGTALQTAVNITDHLTGAHVQDAIEQTTQALNQQDITQRGLKIYQEYNYKKEAYAELRKALSDYIQTSPKKPLIIFVDELDRARPDYSIKVLEAIKHLFAVQGVCFVLAVNREQLAKSIAQIYGNIDFENYYRRFVTREAQLPEPQTLDPTGFIARLATTFFDEKRANGLTFAFRPEDQTEVTQSITTLCKAFKLVPREIEYLFRIFAHFMAVEPSERFAYLSRIHATLFLITTSIKSPTFYKALGNSFPNPNEIQNFIKALHFTPQSPYAERYILFNILAHALHNTPTSRSTSTAICLTYDGKDFNKLTGEEQTRAINQTTRELTRGANLDSYITETPSFHRIYAKLEEWRPFIE